MVYQLPLRCCAGPGVRQRRTVEWIIADKGHLILSRTDVPPNPVELEKNATSLKARIEELLVATRGATPTARCAQRLAGHMLATLLCPERCTLTNLICTTGSQQQDWSAHYRLYSHDRVDERALFGPVRAAVLQALPPEHPLVVAVDDTLARKRGTHIDGVSWRRDPLGPCFQTNLVRAQRHLQFSAAWPLEHGAARMVPVGWFHAPSAPKPSKEAGEVLLQYTGTLSGGGTLGANGQPLLKFEATDTGVDYRALFVRRKDAASQGLLYTPQFSVDLVHWQSSSDTPTVLAGDQTYETASVPFPFFINGKKVRFFRMSINRAP